jgi:hypothetical protein
MNGCGVMFGIARMIVIFLMIGVGIPLAWGSWTAIEGNQSVEGAPLGRLFIARNCLAAAVALNVLVALFVFGSGSSETSILGNLADVSEVAANVALILSVIFAYLGKGEGQATVRTNATILFAISLIDVIEFIADFHNMRLYRCGPFSFF